jgi:hypothetical protein
MAKSKKRGGEKEHRRRIQARKVKVDAQKNAMQKLFNESMKAQIEELKKKYESESGDTKTI